MNEWDSAPITPEQARDWVAKGRRCAAPMLRLAGAVADPAEVEPGRVELSEDWLYGNFMLAWLDPAAEPRRVRHLPDASFFLDLLRRAYAPATSARPDLAELLTGTSRPEMSLTNDVLQIQLRGLDEGYSMIRHHALMLFYAALWLDEPYRTGWFDLYDTLVTYVDGRAEGRPTLPELSAVEAAAFADFTTLAGRTLTRDDGVKLLESPELDDIVDYQLYAGVAIGLLWREYRELPESEREAWHRDQLSERYLRQDYLEENWTNLK
ncbi:MAG TPA: hypothetical protein VFG87_03515 [Amycolatopsis sp.]|jgi:hypothetical protein|nr:hypothetical protein [Amycolatopsis sp.]